MNIRLISEANFIVAIGKLKNNVLSDADQCFLLSLPFWICIRIPLAKNSHPQFPNRAKYFFGAFGVEHTPDPIFRVLLRKYAFIYLLQAFLSNKRMEIQKWKYGNPSTSGGKLETFWHFSGRVIMHQNVSKLPLNSISDVCTMIISSKFAKTATLRPFLLILFPKICICTPFRENQNGDRKWGRKHLSWLNQVYTDKNSYIWNREGYDVSVLYVCGKLVFFSNMETG